MMLFDLFIPVLLIIGFLVGIRLMQSPRTALWGNRVGALCMILAIWLAFRELGVTDSLAWVYIFIGGAVGILFGQQVKMIRMPQTVALFNGLGGAASALVAGTAIIIHTSSGLWVFWFTAALALGIGTLTFSGSIIAALKLQGMVSQIPVFFRGQGLILRSLLLVGAILVLLLSVLQAHLYLYMIIVVFALYGLLMALRIGGADMPVIISFLNSLSGVAAAVSGLVAGNLLLTGVGSLVGVAGMIMTQLMCRAMNRDLSVVLSGFSANISPSKENAECKVAPVSEKVSVENIPYLLQEAKKVILVPGYGMALAQAQEQVKALMDTLEKHGKEVKVAIHPVAGRMPGHMNVLMAEVGIDYEKLYDMDTINPEFAETDIVIVVGACDVISPAASTAEGSPIYGMPVLHVSEAKLILVCNLDEKPGYSGVDNPLYGQDNVITLWGDAAETVPKIMDDYLKYVSSL